MRKSTKCYTQRKKLNVQLTWHQSVIILYYYEYDLSSPERKKFFREDACTADPDKHGYGSTKKEAIATASLKIVGFDLTPFLISWNYFRYGEYYTLNEGIINKKRRCLQPPSPQMLF